MRVLILLFSLCLMGYTQAATLTFPYSAGQMMMVGFAGDTINETSPIVKEIKNYHIGGVILDYTNIKNPKQLTLLTSQLQSYARKYHVYPLLIAINQEGGLINALTYSQGFATQHDPSQFELGQKNNIVYIKSVTQSRAALLKKLGVNLNLAPVADLNINPTNPAIGKLQRSFGHHVDAVINDLSVSVEVYNKTGILCTFKHFPGLGSATKNTDFNSADLSATWNNRELIPYQYLINHHQACPLIMMSHLINNQLDHNIPASLSKKIVTDLLINKLHYQGIIITDDMDASAIRHRIPEKKAIRMAILAGNNIILYAGGQQHNPYHDAKILYTTLLSLQSQPDAYAHIIKSSHKIIALKNAKLP